MANETYHYNNEVVRERVVLEHAHRLPYRKNALENPRGRWGTSCQRMNEMEDSRW